MLATRKGICREQGKDYKKVSFTHRIKAFKRALVSTPIEAFFAGIGRNRKLRRAVIKAMAITQ